MTLRRRALLALACLSLVSPVAFAADNTAAATTAQSHDYPTQGRVEYVLGCMDDNGHDCIAAKLSYDDFVEQSTFSKYATLGGEGGAEFRVDRAKAQTKKFRALQAEAYRACGIGQAAALK
jgi:Spy/CpxP family protein refolding chaperone